MKKVYSLEKFIEMVKVAKIAQDHHCDDGDDDTYLTTDNSTGKEIYGTIIAGAVWRYIEIDDVIFEFTESWNINELDREITYYEHENDEKALVEGICGYTQDLTFNVIDNGEILDYREIINVIKETRDDLYDFDLSNPFK